MNILGGLIGEFLPYIIGGIGVIAAFFGIKAKGRSEERRRARDEDFENAADIRDRADRSDDSLREYGDAGWRER